MHVTKQAGKHYILQTFMIVSLLILLPHLLEAAILIKTTRGKRRRSLMNQAAYSEQLKEQNLADSNITNDP